MSVESPAARLLVVARSGSDLGDVNAQQLAINVLCEVLQNKHTKGEARKLCGEEAVAFMDLVQILIEVMHQDHPDHNFGFAHIEELRSCRQASRRLCANISKDSKQFPSCIEVPDAERISQDPVQGGGWADVHRGKLRGSGVYVALKALRVFPGNADADKIKRNVCREAMTWRQLRHESILEFHGVDFRTFQESERIAMVSTWMKNGTIIEYQLRKVKDGTLKRDVDPIDLLTQVSRGLEYLHGENVVHGDIKGANVLITEHGRAVLADFGLAIYSNATMNQQSLSGSTERWMAPELMCIEELEAKRTPETDIYSFAHFCMEVFTLQLPFHAKSPQWVIINVSRGSRPTRPTTEQCYEREMPDAVWELITRCWAPTATLRPNAREITINLEQSG